MRMLDLFSGRFGWSSAFAERGWDCVGVDLTEPQEIPLFTAPGKITFIEMNVLDITDEWMHLGAFDFICASSPCEQFSVWGQRHFHPDPPYPALGVKLFEHTRALCEASGVPYVMENVRPAQKFVGNAVNRCGPFFLWGCGVPPLMWQGITKGFGAMRYDRTTKGWGSDEANGLGKIERARHTAVIPPELAHTVCDYAERLLEQQQAKNSPRPIEDQGLGKDRETRFRQTEP